MSETPGSPEAMYSPDQLFERMHHRVVELAATWKLYRSLYSDKEQVKRMNRVSRVGFGIMQRSMIHDLIRGVYAITDQAGKGKRKNLSLECSVQKLRLGRGIATP